MSIAEGDFWSSDDDYCEAETNQKRLQYYEFYSEGFNNQLKSCLISKKRYCEMKCFLKMREDEIKVYISLLE